MDNNEMPPKESTSQRAGNISQEKNELENKVKEMDHVSTGSLMPPGENVKTVKDIIKEFEKRSQPHCVKDTKVPLEIDEHMIVLTEIPVSSNKGDEINYAWKLLDDASEALGKITDL